jgi:hypothetical protein
VFIEPPVCAKAFETKNKTPMSAKNVNFFIFFVVVGFRISGFDLISNPKTENEGQKIYGGKQKVMLYQLSRASARGN